MIRKVAPLALALGLLAGCALSSHPKIADLKYNPGRYQNHSVTVVSATAPARAIQFDTFI